MSRDREPRVRILRGAPTDEELAAVLVALRALSAASALRARWSEAAPGSADPRRGGGRAHWIRHQPGRRGPGAWRWSGWH
ncbi:acyl-CoA carboxylase subunit epsilon [Streptomyces sp. NPDC001985]|uniref:acyl-CoA carboxylase subunit epsilon n=1 Tax=Streptomyces sp. NPDC001985 TaxID=3154406 RepID=UPI003328F3BF